MNEAEILSEIAQVLEVSTQSLKLSDDLQSRNWDSLALVSFMAVMDEKYHVVLPARELGKVRSVADLLGLVKQSLGKK